VQKIPQPRRSRNTKALRRLQRTYAAVEDNTPTERQARRLRAHFVPACKTADDAGTNIWTMCRLLTGSADWAIWAPLIELLSLIDKQRPIPECIEPVSGESVVVLDCRALIRQRPAAQAGPPPPKRLRRLPAQEAPAKKALSFSCAFKISGFCIPCKINFAAEDFCGFQPENFNAHPPARGPPRRSGVADSSPQKRAPARQGSGRPPCKTAGSQPASLWGKGTSNYGTPAAKN
jgi:hypothetical protein